MFSALTGCTLRARSLSLSNRSCQTLFRRWEALLAEYGAAEEEHVDLLSSFSEPFSVEQKSSIDGVCCSSQDASPEGSEICSGMVSLPQDLSTTRLPSTTTH
jgi:hypothetical protein